MMAILSYLALSALFFSSLAFGLKLLLVSRGRIIKRYHQWSFSLAETSSEERDSYSEKAVIWGARVVGLLLLLVAVWVAWLIYLKMT